MGDEEIKDAVEKMRNVLFGNGKKGLCESVRDLEEEVKAMRESPDKIGKWVIRALMGAILLLQVWSAVSKGGGIDKDTLQKFVEAVKQIEETR